MLKKQELEKLYQEMKYAFPGETRTLVFVCGNFESSILLIGEAPGEKENRVGVPFVGRAGVCLNQLLHAAGIEREDVAVTNRVPFRPENNNMKSVTSEEMDVYDKFLSRQIEIIDPNVIVPLGNVPTRFFLPGERSITRARGQMYKLGTSYFVVPTFHPSYTLRNRRMMPLVIEDFKRAKRIDEVVSARQERVVLSPTELALAKHEVSGRG